MDGQADPSVCHGCIINQQSNARARRTRLVLGSFRLKSGKVREVYMAPKLIPKIVRGMVKDASLWTGVYDQTFFGVYSYMFEPKQLIFITECIAQAASVPGCFVEAGCAQGATTVFLNKFMNAEQVDRDYYAIDTFSGFPSAHAEYEINIRRKPASIKNYFVENKKAWFDKTMALHKIQRVRSIECDVTKFDFAAISPIAICLLDVDLYPPIKEVLPKIYAAMAPGGIIIIDDCKANNLWDGALQAYEEFVSERQLPREIVAEKLGVLRVGGAHQTDRRRTCPHPASAPSRAVEKPSRSCR